MASYSAMSEDQFLCSICLGVFTNPATIPCGHSFCKPCLEGDWNSSGDYAVCAVCNTRFTPTPTIQVNIVLRDLVESFKGASGSGGEAVDRPTVAPGEVSCDACLGSRMTKAVISCLVCMSSYCLEHEMVHNARFSRHQLVRPLANLEKRMCLNHERLLERYCRTDKTMMCGVCDTHPEPAHQVVSMQVEFLAQKAQLTEAQAEVKEKLKATWKEAEQFNSSFHHCKDVATSQIRFVNGFRLDLVSKVGLICDRSNIEARRRVDEMKSTASCRRRVLEDDITALTSRGAELEQLIGSSDSFVFFNILPSLPSALPDGVRGQCSINILKDLLGNLLNTLMKDIAKLLKMGYLSTNGYAVPEIAVVKEFTVEVTPDPSTAHPSLLFKQASREIRVDRSKMGQMFPLSAQRFTQVLCVLATQWFSSHRAYWEVEVEDWTWTGSGVWCVGVATKSSMTSRGVDLTPEKGFWVLVHRGGKLWPSTNTTPVAIGTQRSMAHVGVYFDGLERRVSFYDVNLGHHLYTYHNVPTNERLFPVFSPDFFTPGDNPANHVMIVRPLTATNHLRG
ncbi:E3 ubiquitin-protein ligase TRIM7 [Salmo salar]|uniref:E3 ubiquitin-protein ligase TRIM7 n=1 Tax=Salmo salar TaxID=8030 RepID=A0A1S3N8X1_SALSA|nr:E3 ubiquitin-protein ligase TRIM7 [Salmo salar]|eukprot:XP_014011938.1 PREDICTED: tripartite motif-containing protein 7-like [Salmo salar]